jgi:hypothetical protein
LRAAEKEAREAKRRERRANALDLSKDQDFARWLDHHARLKEIEREGKEAETERKARAKTDLIAKKTLIEAGGMVWRPYGKSDDRFRR